MSTNNEIEQVSSIEPREEYEIKSDAVVKYSLTKVPSGFNRLMCNTNLHTGPVGWVGQSSKYEAELRQTVNHRPGFSSFRLANQFIDCLGDVQVVSAAENIKTLLKIPFDRANGISMLIHRVGNTLLIDEFQIARFLTLRKENEGTWLYNFILNHLMIGDNEKSPYVYLLRKSRRVIEDKKLLGQFLCHSVVDMNMDNQLMYDASPSSPSSPSTSEPISATTTTTTPLLPEPKIEQNVPDPNYERTFSRNVVWTFEDIRMLVGNDMPIFGDATRPCISLRLHDAKEPINVLTGVDYWLDNLMCNVPEVLMCYHIDGIVQKYVMIKTEDLPHLENSKFSPQIIRNVI